MFKDPKIVNIASIILAGGKGTRLFPLTKFHSKPAVCYGGRYRLIDIPISNSLNSNIRQIFVIGQYLATELQHHLSQTYQFDVFLPGSLDFLTPEELPSGEKIWFEGTADAIRKNINTIGKAPVDYFLILSGDQLYNIDFYKMLSFAIEKDADLTIATMPVEKNEAKRMGLMKVDQNSYITDFQEKPTDDKVLKQFQLQEKYLKEKELDPQKEYYLGSMGIYIFKRDILLNLLFEDTREDFGKHLIPTQMKKGKTASFMYDGYWEDIGTISSYYAANLSLINSSTGLKTYNENQPIYSQAHHLPGAKIHGTKIKDAIICEGSIIKAQEITNSIIGLRSTIHENTIIRNSIIAGNSYYSAPAHQSKYLPKKFEIGKNCLIEKAIIDEHVYIGNNVKLLNKDHLTNYDGDFVYIRDGIIIVPAGAEIPDNFEL